jgi:outer membrane protein assembly factor BamB
MNYKRIFKAALFCVFALATLAPFSFAQDWTQWRGANRDGRITSFSAPKVWPEQLKMKWKVDVGFGHSSPLVVGKKVFLQSRQGEEEVTSCFDLDTGKLLWKDGYTAPYQMNPAALGHGKGPKSTPVIAGGKLYTLGITGILSCYDTATGKMLWRKEFSKRFKSNSPDFGTAMSPVVDKGLVIAHVGGSDSGALIAFDAETGTEKWSWKNDGPGYASPIVVELAGTRQVVTQSQQNIIGINLANGELLWQIPFTTEYVQNIVTPILYKETLIFSGLDKGTFAVKLTKSNGKLKLETVWTNKEVSMYMNSPVLSGDYLYGMSHKKKGQFFCMDAKTGATLWTSNGREGDNAAILNTDSLLFLLDDGADLTIASADAKKYEVLKKYSVAQSATWAHPAVIGKQILIKDYSSLALWSVE